jgi:hypothetical protein
MYTSFIGLKFLDLYNRKSGSDFSAAQFFEKVMFPLFFDDIQHLMHVSNSPFFQNPSAKRLAESGLSKAAVQLSDLQTKVEAIASGARSQPDASIYVGFAADGPDQNTSGQVTSIQRTVHSQEIYASWIGNALSMRVAGGACLLTESEDVLWDIFEGWKAYRNLIRQTPGLEGRQIETWNGQWFSRDRDAIDFLPLMKAGKIETRDWMDVAFALSQFHPASVLPVYVFSFGQTNTTYGFVNFHLPAITRLGELSRSFVELNSKPVQDLFRDYKTEYKLITAISLLGEIGLRALKPKDFAKIFEGNFKQTKHDVKNEHKFIHFKLWITAMLNNREELRRLAADLAKLLVSLETGTADEKRAKANNSSFADKIMDSKSRHQFVEALSDILEKRNIPGTGVMLAEVIEQLLKLSADQIPLFRALIRFEYLFIKSQITQFK